MSQELRDRSQLPALGGSLVNPAAATEGELTLDEKYMVVLVRPGVGAKKYYVPPGSTWGDLLKAAKATAVNQDLMVGDQKVKEEDVIQPNTAVFVVPRPKNAIFCWIVSVLRRVV